MGADAAARKYKKEPPRIAQGALGDGWLCVSLFLFVLLSFVLVLPRGVVWIDADLLKYPVGLKADEVIELGEGHPIIVGGVRFHELVECVLGTRLVQGVPEVLTAPSLILEIGGILLFVNFHG